MNMADVIANKSTNVVSNKQSDVCDTKSNSVLIDFDTITPSSSQLIRVSDDDDDENKSKLKNNVKNESIVHEKSLQELIENELALRICPNNECESQLMISHDCDNRKGSDSGEPIRSAIMMSMQSDGNFSLTTATFIENEIEYCNVSHELFTYPNQNGDDISIDKEPVDFIGANFDNIGDEDTSDKFQAINSNDTDNKTDKLIFTDVEELAANAEGPVKNLTYNDPINNYNVSQYEIDQPSTNNEYLKNECHKNSSADLSYLNLSEVHDNTVETIRVRDEVSEISNDANIIGPLQSSNTKDLNPIQVLTNNLLESVENTQDIHANDNTITTPDKEKIIYCQKNQQYNEINSTEVGRIVEGVDKTNRYLEDIKIDAMKPDMVIETIINETNNNPKTICSTNVREECMSCAIPVVQLPILDDVISNEISNAFHHEIHEEVITTSNTIISSTAKNSAKTKKKKINGIADNVALPASTPRIKKTKKNKKNDLEKENISVNVNSEDTSMHTNNSNDYLNSGESLGVDDLSNVNVKSLTQCYAMVSTRYGVQEKYKKEAIETGVSIKLLKSSFNKFDALSKKSILNTRSVDTAKVQQQLSLAGQNGDTNPNCRRCDKVVFQMEQTKAEGLIWHKNCFRCVQCSKQLSVDNYQSHECTLYCKAHFKELFQPKPVDESNQPVSPRKPEMIIRENQPKELPPDVVRASDKPDLGLEELSSLNVKSRFQVFEKKSETETMSDIERSPSQISVKRSPSILSKLAKFQAKGMDIGVADESLNGIPYEESSESDEEEDAEEFDDVDAEIIKSKRTTRERPMSFSKMDDMKSRWEVTSQQGKRESQREARKEEIAGIRSRLFMGKQGKMKEMYQQAVATSERVMKINPVDEILCSTHARSIKERFERGEPIADDDDEYDNKMKQEKPDEDVIAAGISRKSRTLFLELDATAAKAGGPPVTPTNPKLSPDTSRRARDAFMGRQVSNDVVRSTDTTEEVQVETSDISNKFKFFETYKEPEQQRRQFRITPPRDGQVKMNSPEREIYRDPDVIRADDRLDEIVRSDTTKKMLSIFRQMEENATKEDVPDGPKPLKRFTPPPEDKYAKATASDSDEDGEEDGNETSGGSDEEEERNPNYVRASDKVEDEFLKQAQNAAKAKTLRAKFEQWETNDEKIISHDNVAEIEMAQTISGEHTSIESAKSLRARFESLGSQSGELPRTQKCKVNRFV